jgi:iron complex transport system ATP-binding protein
MRARGLTVRRGGRPVLRDLDLTVARGEVVAVLGPNGAGKSTLIEALSGALAPAAGEVSLADRPIARWDARTLARHRAVLPQHGALNAPFRVREVVALGRTPHADRRPDAVVATCLALAGVEALADRDFLTLSGGERQRVHLARVLAQLHGPADPRFLLLDEPVNHLDPAHQHQVLAIARGLARDEGVGVLAVLHDLNLAASYADRLVVLDAGRAVADGPPAEVLTAALVHRVFRLDVEVVVRGGIPQILARPLTVGPHPAPRRDHAPAP